MTQDFILLTLAVMTCTVTGLIAIWSALGRPHWFLQALMLEGFLALWLIIPAYEILLLLSCQCAVAVLALLATRLLRRRALCRDAEPGLERAVAGRPRLQFSVCDLLLLMVAVSLALAIALGVAGDTARAEQSVWQSWSYFTALFSTVLAPAPWRPRLPAPWVIFAFAGGGAGLATFVAAWAVLGRQSARLRVMVAYLFILLAAYVALGWFPWLRVPPWFRVTAASLILLSLSLTGWLALLRISSRIGMAKDSGQGWIGKRSHRGAIRSALKWAARVFVVLVSLLVVLPPGFVFYKLATPTPILEVTLPDPNGYEDLVHAGAALVSAVPDVDTAQPAELEAFVANYGKAFDTARRGLARECQVPVKYSATHLAEIASLRALARAFVAEGELAERQGRTADAIACYLDCVRAGYASGRGGLILDALVGRALGGIGQSRLHRIRKKVTPEQCRQIIHALIADANRWEPIEGFVARDRIWMQHAIGWQGRLSLLLDEWLKSDTVQGRVYVECERRHTAIRWLTVTALALHAYKAQHGVFPEQQADLVPDYLSALLEDPFSGKPLVYRRTTTGYVLYSVGSNGKDDGGRSQDYAGNIGDFLLDDEGQPVWAEESGD